MKACKNAAEIAALKAAHLRDAVALAKFLHWFDGVMAGNGATEIGAAVALEGFRAEDPTFRDISFPTISAAGPHAALPHYRVGEEHRHRDPARASFSSTAAASTTKAPPTSPARSRSARRRRKCATVTRAC